MEMKVNKDFTDLIINGLSSNKKYLSSMYFYDDYGSKLFQMITELPEYYLTKCEFEIMQSHKNQILNDFKESSKLFNIIELGSGDGHKTKILLKHFIEQGVDFQYSPIDISKEALDSLEINLKSELSHLKINKYVGNYHKILKDIISSDIRNILLFMGSNIGNFKYNESINFLKMISNSLNKGDLVLIGFDLKKEPDIILNAYNDSQGVTKEFNLNILRRINREYDANFDLNSFKHFPTYNPDTMECKSFLVSTRKQEVKINKLDLTVQFQYAEHIFTELSQKYDIELIKELTEPLGYKIKNQYYDCKQYFVNILFEIS